MKINIKKLIKEEVQKILNESMVEPYERGSIFKYKGDFIRLKHAKKINKMSDFGTQGYDRDYAELRHNGNPLDDTKNTKPIKFPTIKYGYKAYKNLQDAIKNNSNDYAGGVVLHDELNPKSIVR